VLVAGAGLAGLAAARALEARGVRVSVIEARDRVGGRTWTIRDGFHDGQHAEGGADFIESDQRALVSLAHDLGLTLTPIIRRGFGYYGTDRRGRLSRQSIESGFRAMATQFAPLVREYQRAKVRWDSAVARRLSRTSLAAWLLDEGAPAWVIQRFRGMRGLFLADPEDLSLLAVVDLFADLSEFGWGDTFRVRDGNDRIATEMARRLREPVRFGTVLRRVRQTKSGVVATLQGAAGLAELSADYLIVTLPASALRDVVLEPALPDAQRDAIGHLKYGPATRVLLQFSSRFWKKAGQPNAFGSDQPTGAIWDGNEQQKGKSAILSLLAGGGASRELQAILEHDGPTGVVSRLKWLGRPTKLLAAQTVVWDADPWAKGGYAYFDPGFDPLWRDWLARPAGRVFFAGEHTSARWQGYMNGAVESGLRAAAEVPR
jgi:monoamine oxidase